jgi:hypothetical protein
MTGASRTEGSLAAVRAATTEAGSAYPARFAFIPGPDQRPAELGDAVRAALAPLSARVTPMSALDPDVLVVELPGRVFSTDTGAVFSAAYTCRDEFGLAQAEPDLPVRFFPDDGRGQAATPGAVAPRSADAILGCWAPEQPELNATPHWALDVMRVPRAWQFSETAGRPSRGEGVIIAQPDTGVTTHAELADVLRVPSFDVLDNDSDPTDPMTELGNPGHGTGTASVVVSGPALVVLGSAPRARHMPIRAIASVVRITQVSVAQAIDWAVANGAQVITMSLGGIPSFSLDRALRRAVAADVIVLAAAGNCVRTVVWPARYDDCIAVAGTDSVDAPWIGTCRGASVDIAAPGQNVYRAQVSPGSPTGNAVGQGQGTSFAVALTAGVAALWLAHHGRDTVLAAAHARGETLQRMFLRLVTATARRPAGWDASQFGAGVVDAHALLAADLGLDGGRQPRMSRSGSGQLLADSVRSLVVETAGAVAASDTALDWTGLGREIATALLSRQLDDRPGTAVSARSGPSSISAELDGAAVDPQLRDWLGAKGARSRGRIVGSHADGRSS